jgi:cardiolipin synthase A/B
MAHDFLSSETRPATLIHGRALAEQILSRAAGAPPIGGNSIRLVVDAEENYPAGLTMILWVWPL